MDFGTITRVIDFEAIYKAGLTQAYDVLQSRMNQLMSFRKVLGQVDFQCGWDKDGVCFAERMENRSSPMCCCVTCSTTAGFIKDDPTPVLKPDLAIYNSKWDEKTGFWTPLGCSLPVVLRGTSCLTYNCLHLVNTTKARDLRSVINDVRFSMDRLSKEIITINERIVL